MPVPLPLTDRKVESGRWMMVGGRLQMASGKMCSIIIGHFKIHFSKLTVFLYPLLLKVLEDTDP